MPASSRRRRSSRRSKSGRKIRSGARWSRFPLAIEAPQTARNVRRGIPSQSAQLDHARVSSTIVSPTSNTTARIVTRGGGSAAILPGGPTERPPRQLLRLQAGSLVDLFHAAQVEPVDEDGLDIRVADPLIAERRHRVDDRHEHLARAVEEPVRLGARVKEHGPDDPKWRRLE